MGWSVLILNPPDGRLGPLRGAVRDVVGPGCVVHDVQSVAGLTDTLEAGFVYDLVFIDVEEGDGVRSGLEAVAAVRARDPNVALVAVACHGSVSGASRAIDAGASDFLVMGERLTERVGTLLRKLGRVRRLGQHAQLLQAELAGQHQIIGDSPQIRALVRRIERVGPIPRPILVVGERGTGKELVAWNLHAASGRPRSPMVSVNCAAFSEALLESELFGHEKGAYTGAAERVVGRFEQADGGTLFLDEIGGMSLPFQQKILRAVEYGVFTRVGGVREIHSTARVIGATNADLAERIRTGEFLPDLYDRLAFEVIEVPPLREREGDVPLLAWHFLSAFQAEFPNLRGRRLSREALDALARYPFPGNVRELKHIIERAAYREGGAEITAEDLGLRPAAAPASGAAGPGAGFEAEVAALKARLIRDALAGAGGNQAEAARALKLSYHQFRYYWRQLREAG